MKQIRHSVFETNSSSTHSITICTEEQFNKWKSGELLFDYWNNCFAENVQLTDRDKEEARRQYESQKGDYWKEWNQLSTEEIESWYNRYANVLQKNDMDDMKTYKQYFDDYDDYLERYTKYYTSPSGDKIVIFGKYGYDG